MRNRIVLSTALVAWSLTACTEVSKPQRRGLRSSFPADAPVKDENTATNSDDAVASPEIILQLAQTYCIGCHNGSNPSSAFNVNISPSATDPESRANWLRAVDAVVNKRMPMGSPLPDDVIAIFAKFGEQLQAAAGGAGGGSTDGGGTDGDVATGDEATFLGMLPLLEQKCVSCHNANLPQGDFVANKYEQTGGLTKWYSAVTHVEDKTMPPKPSPGLTDESIAKFKAWRDAGFPYDATSPTQPVVFDGTLLDERRLGYGEKVSRLLPRQYASLVKDNFNISQEIGWLLSDLESESELAFYLGGTNVNRNVLLEDRNTSITTVLNIYAQAQYLAERGINFTGSGVALTDPNFDEAVHQLFLKAYGRRARADEIALIRAVFPKLGGNPWSLLISSILTSAEAWHVVKIK